jgi:predicted AAA+ superfamily ATPase
VYQLDDAGRRELAEAAPQRLTEGDPPILIDEWQRFPQAWDLVRRAVDEDPSPGRFLLTGSASPSDNVTHSGAGRIVTVRMRPLSLAERALGPVSVSVRELLTGQRAPIAGTTQIGLADYTTEIVRSGFPAIRSLEGRVLRSQLDGYIDRIVERDFLELGHRVRSPGTLRRWMAAYAAASSTTAAWEVIRDAASAGESDKPAKTTTGPYRSTLEQLWMIDEVPAWIPTRNHLRRLATSPVHQLADPALAARLLGVGVDGLIEGSTAGPAVPRDGTLLGALFESLVTLSVRTYAQAAEARVAHLRTRGGEHEVDLIVERADGRIVAFEVKLSATVIHDDVRHLQWLSDALGPDLLDAAVITTGSDAYRRADGICVIPAALLTA